MDVVELVGRLVFAGLFLFYGVQHFRKFDFFSGYAGSKGTPVPRLAVAGTGLMLLVGGTLVALGAWPDLGALILFVFLVPVAFTIHPFWKETDPATRGNEQGIFLKDVALGGAALLFLGLAGSASHTLTGPLF
jgi:putative oxidoreductase